jgi:predicted amidophosphoribosyltransferase
MEVEFCPSCSAVVNTNYLYCPSCGARLHKGPDFVEVVDRSLGALEVQQNHQMLHRLDEMLCRLATLEEALDAFEAVR